MDIYGIRQANLQLLTEQLSFDERSRKHRLMKDIAALLDLGDSHFSQIRGGKKIGDDVARGIEKKRGLPFGWMDNRHDAIGESRAAYNVSQLSRPDPATIVKTYQLLETAFALQAKDFSLPREAVIFCDAYEWLANDDRPVDQRNLVDFGRWLSGRESLGGSENAVGEGHQLAGPAGRAHRSGTGS